MVMIRISKISSTTLDWIVRILYVVLMIILGPMMMSCYSVQSFARCGMGRDYICSPQPAIDTNNKPTVQIVCRCMNKEDLKAN